MTDVINYALNDQVGLEFGYIYYYYPSTAAGTDTEEIMPGLTSLMINRKDEGWLLAGLAYDF